jgi:hypothetical protein
VPNRSRSAPEAKGEHHYRMSHPWQLLGVTLSLPCDPQCLQQHHQRRPLERVVCVDGEVEMALGERRLEHQSAIQSRTLGIQNLIAPHTSGLIERKEDQAQRQRLSSTAVSLASRRPLAMSQIICAAVPQSPASNRPLPQLASGYCCCCQSSSSAVASAVVRKLRRRPRSTSRDSSREAQEEEKRRRVNGGSMADGRLKEEALLCFRALTGCL